MSCESRCCAMFFSSSIAPLATVCTPADSHPMECRCLWTCTAFLLISPLHSMTVFYNTLLHCCFGLLVLLFGVLLCHYRGMVSHKWHLVFSVTPIIMFFPVFCMWFKNCTPKGTDSSLTYGTHSSVGVSSSGPLSSSQGTPGWKCRQESSLQKTIGL